MNVFVYGSLKGGIDGLIGNKIGDGIVRGLTLYDMGAFPAAIEKPDHVVEGELWTIRREQWIEELDRIEGHPWFYRRELREVELLSAIDHEPDRDRVFQAYVYVFQHDVTDKPHVGARWERTFRFR